MMKRTSFLIVMALLLSSPLFAQKKTSRGKSTPKSKPKTTTVVEVKKRQHSPASERQGEAPAMKIKELATSGRYAFTTLDGVPKCEAEFDQIYSWSSITKTGLFQVKMDGKWFLMDNEGRSLLKEGMKEIEIIDRIIKAQDFSGKFQLYDLDGNLLGGKTYVQVELTSHAEDAAAINVTTSDMRTTAIDFAGNELPGVFQNADCDLDPSVKSSITEPVFYSAKYGIINADGEVIVEFRKASANIKHLSQGQSLSVYGGLYKKNKLEKILSREEYDNMLLIYQKNGPKIQVYDILGNVIIPYVKAYWESEAFEKGKKKVLAYLKEYPKYRDEINAKVYAPYMRLMEKKKSLPAYADFCEGPSLFDIANEKGRVRKAAEEKERKEMLAREAQRKKEQEAEARKQKQRELAEAKKQKQRDQAAAATARKNKTTTASTAQNKVARSDGYSPNAENKAYSNGALTDLEKANRHYSTPTYGTTPFGDYYYLSDDGYSIHIVLYNYQGRVEANTYDNHFMSFESFTYGGERGDWMYFYGVNISTHNKWGEMDLYIAKDWSKVLLTTNFGNIFNKQCSEYTAIKSKEDHKMLGWGYANSVFIGQSRAAEARTQQMMKDIQSEINSIGSSRSSGTTSTPSSRNDGVRVKQYTPNYTGSSEQVWCDECHGYDAPHVHITKR